MSLISMTGFARSDGAGVNVRWHWELKTVNGKSMDVRCRLPYGYEQLEPDLRKLFAQYISRGNCQVSLSLKEEEATGELTINERALATVVDAARRLVAEAGATAPSADGLLALKGILDVSDQAQDEGIIKARNVQILGSLETALQDLVAMRKREGEHLNIILTAQLTEIEKLVYEVRREGVNTEELMASRVNKQVARVVEATQSLDEDRLYLEAVILAAKADITEELDRLDTHIKAAKICLTASGPVGRKLEFLIQEFNREANTLCSKAATSKITALGLDIKAAIDQMREQVMNIE